jgi:hypothetical protein
MLSWPTFDSKMLEGTDNIIPVAGTGRDNLGFIAN